MKLLVFCLTLFAFVSIDKTVGIECTANFCQLVLCMPITADSCAGKIVKNGGMCGCCDACLSVLNPGDTCFSILTVGLPSTVTCPDQYHCDTITHKCISN